MSQKKAKELRRSVRRTQSAMIRNFAHGIARLGWRERVKLAVLILFAKENKKHIR